MSKKSTFQQDTPPGTKESFVFAITTKDADPESTAAAVVTVVTATFGEDGWKVDYEGNGISVVGVNGEWLIIAPTPVSGKIKTVGLLPVELLQPKLEADEITASGDPVVTTAPRFARWRNGFTEPGGQFKQDWIKSDPDRVVVRIPGDALPWVNVKVKGITGVSGRTTDDGFLELTQKNGGWESEPFLFVADDIDDTKYNGD